MEQTTENTTKDFELYSGSSISIGTFLGGPLAAGILIRENYKALDKKKKGNIALVIGIIAAIILFGGIFSVPERYMEKLPNALIPVTYVAIVWGIVEQIHGPLLKQHKEFGNKFASFWKAAGIGLLAGIVSFVLVFGAVLITSYDEFLSSDELINDNEEYIAKIEKFHQNETASMTIYDKLGNATDFELIQDLTKKTIPLWEENIQLLNEASQMENLPAEYQKENDLLMQYSKLRLRTFQLMKEALRNQTNEHDAEIESLQNQIEEMIQKNNN